ncbi:hypothetical protein Leryth_012262 [Lithospermum erythrorhizon]|nr:hypothetical protein Leryth_012262 [Lithospermum erythrorhizon]
MGASRKLQGEIDRVLKKVQEGVEVFDSIWNKVYDTDNANQKEKFEADLKKEIKKLQRYRDQIKTWIQSSEIKDKKVSAAYEQDLMDARKSIEREMERFKICEKETKTKAFSKEGLGQQPKTDPKEKAKSETRDWLNNVVSELENQIDIFEAEMEGLTVKKGKTRPPRLAHLETSIVRHKAHIIKLELILRLLDNDNLSTEQVNDVKDFLDDYVDRNQEDFDEFSDVDDLYSTLPLDKVELLEDLVTVVPPGLSKGTSTVLSMKNLVAAIPVHAMTSVTSSVQHGASTLEQAEEMARQDSNVEVVASTPPSKGIGIGSSAPPTPTGGVATSGATINSTLIGMSNSVNEEENASSSFVKSTQIPSDISLKGSGRGGLPSQPALSIQLGSGSSSSTNDALGSIMPASDATKRNILGAEDRVGSNGMVQPLDSPLANKVMSPQDSRDVDGISSVDVDNSTDPRAVSNQGSSASAIPGVQWRPGSSFQNQGELFRGRTEIAPDQREKFLQLYQQVQQQGQNNLLGVGTHSGGNQPQFSVHQQNSLFQQSQPTAVHQPSNQHTGSRDTGVGHGNADEQLQRTSEDSLLNAVPDSGLAKNEDNTKASRALDSPALGVGSFTEASLLKRENDLTSGQSLQSSQPSGTLGVIPRRSVADLISNDNLGASVANSGVVHDNVYNLHMLEAALHKLPQPKDSDLSKSYTPKHPAVTPASYPQVQAPIVSNPAFWERLGQDTYAMDSLFFAFYFQPNTYQQYLAAKELKKQSWRYHWKFNTWFQRHEEPIVATDDFERGKYLYFDFHITNDEQNGWCQRVKNDFTFEYNYLEDELIV